MSLPALAELPGFDRLSGSDDVLSGSDEEMSELAFSEEFVSFSDEIVSSIIVSVVSSVEILLFGSLNILIDGIATSTVAIQAAIELIIIFFRLAAIRILGFFASAISSSSIASNAFSKISLFIYKPPVLQGGQAILRVYVKASS